MRYGCVYLALGATLVESLITELLAEDPPTNRRVQAVAGG